MEEGNPLAGTGIEERWSHLELEEKSYVEIPGSFAEEPALFHQYTEVAFSTLEDVNYAQELLVGCDTSSTK